MNWHTKLVVYEFASCPAFRGKVVAAAGLFAFVMESGNMFLCLEIFGDNARCAPQAWRCWRSDAEGSKSSSRTCHGIFLTTVSDRRAKAFLRLPTCRRDMASPEVVERSFCICWSFPGHRPRTMLMKSYIQKEVLRTISSGWTAQRPILYYSHPPLISWCYLQLNINGEISQSTQDPEYPRLLVGQSHERY